MSTYFSHIPSTIYNGVAATNIITRARFKQSVLDKSAAYYPYQIKAGERPEQIAETYYGSANYDWVIYLANEITDPYYEWYKTDDEINALLIKKFGSTLSAQTRIAYYGVNYETDDRVISTSTYNAMIGAVKKYWMPILGYNDQVINYQRKELNLYAETNQVVSLVGTFTAVAENDKITQGAASGFVKYSSTTNIVLQHITGTFAAGSASCGTVTTATIINQSIPLTEISYWSPITEMDAAFIDNHKRQTIRLLSPNFLDVVERDMRDLFPA